MIVFSTVLSVAVALAILVTVFNVQKKRHGNDSTRHTARRDMQPKADTRYHAVSLKYTDNACQAAKDVQGKRYLSSAAPRVPLPECDASKCDCRFAHHNDRRSRENRRSPIGQGFGSTGGYIGVEQRNASDRRVGASGQGSWR